MIDRVARRADIEHHKSRAAKMLDTVTAAYEEERRRCADPTVTWATVSVNFSEVIGVSDDNPEAWLLVGVLVEAVARLAVAE